MVRFIFKKRGFTVLELLIVMSILVVLISVVTYPFSNFRESNILGVETENVISLVSRARMDTLSSKDDSVYGVHFESDRVVLFKGDTFVEPSADNVEIELSQQIEINNISLNGAGVDVVFERLSGKTDHYGTIAIVSTSNASSSRTITVYGTGLVDISL